MPKSFLKSGVVRLAYFSTLTFSFIFVFVFLFFLLGNINRVFAYYIEGSGGTGCVSCGSGGSGGSGGSTDPKYTSDALSKMHDYDCHSAAECNGLSDSWDLVGYGLPDGSIIYDCVGSGCSDSKKEGEGGAGYSLSCGLLLPPRCQDLLPIYSNSDSSYLKKGMGVYNKDLASLFSNFGLNQVDANLYDDYVPHYVDTGIEALGAASLSENFFSTPEYILFSRPTCLAQMRDDAYIYIPRGWYSFGLKANQSVTSGSNSCFYCRGEDLGCPGNNTQTSWYAGTKRCTYASREGLARNEDVAINCSCNDIIGTRTAQGSHCSVTYDWNDCSADGNDHGCRFDCRGSLYSWLAASGSGNESSPYNPNPVIPYDPNWNPAPEDVAEKVNLSYSYTWQTNPSSGETNPPSRMNDGVVGSNWVKFDASSQPAKINIDFGKIRSIDSININFLNTFEYGTGQHYTIIKHCASPVIDVYCDGVLAGHNDYGNVGGSTANLSTVPLLKNCEKLRIEFYHNYEDGIGYKPLGLSEIVVNGWNVPIEETNIINPGHMEANFTRFNNWFPLVSIDFSQISGAVAASATSPVDTVWSSPKYYSGGWYPIQTSKKYDLFDNKYYAFRIFDPQLWWRKCNNSNSSSCGQQVGLFEERYANGSLGGAAISACQPGAVSCVFTPNPTTIYEGETKDITIGTIKDYSGSVNVVENPDSSDLTINSLLPVDSSGNLKINVSAHDLPDMNSVQVNLHVTANASDPSATGCDGNTTVTILPRKNWWQTQNMDVTTTGKISSFLPSNTTYFDLKGSDSPGIPVYNSGTPPSWGNGSVSETGWLANTSISSASGYNYEYFFSRVPAEVKNEWNKNNGAFSGDKQVSTIGDFGASLPKDGNNYSWVLIQDGNLTIGNGTSSFAVGTSKLVIFVNGDLNIKSNVSVSSSGFVMFVVSGNISIDPSVDSVSGIYLTNGQFKTGTLGRRQDTKGITVTGSVVALSGVNLQRSLNDNTTPAEKFIFSPSLLLQIPYNFFQRNFNWREVNP